MTIRKKITAMSLGMAVAAGHALAVQGPSSSVTPYLVPVQPGVEFTSILTVGDTVKRKHKGNETYSMVGIPDGLGAYDNGDGTITVLMNHELVATSGMVRAHGGKGAFVSKWQIRKSDLKVLNGEDLIKTGREHGASYEPPSLGRVAWENVVASPHEQDKTVVAGMDDSTPGSVYVHVGQKQDHGAPIEEAGLHGGNLYAIGVAGIAAEDRAAGIAAGTRFSLVAPTSGTKFLRPEDGAWDTVNPNRFYFVTTDRFDQVKDGAGSTVGRTRLWRLTFDSIENPESGGSIEMMLDGTEAGNMYDNITVDSAGKVILLEDVGNQQHNGKIWKYDPTTDALTLLGKHDPARFGDIGVAAAAGFNQDEESSGVIEVTDLFEGVGRYETGLYRYFLLDVQAQFNISATDPELVEKGQFLMMRTWK